MLKRFLSLLTMLTLMLSCARAEMVDDSDPTLYPPLSWSFSPAPYAPHADGFLPDNGGYHDDSLDVRVETFRRDDTTVWAASSTR